MIMLRLFLLLLLAASSQAQVYKGAQVGLFSSEQNVQDLINAGANIARYQIHSVGWEAAKTVTCSTYKSAANDYLNHLDSLLHLPIKWVLDLHVPIGGRVNGRDIVFDRPDLQDCIVSFWIEAAHRYNGNQKVFAFDILNEPLGKPAEINKLMNRAYRAIRAVDKNRIVIVAGNQHSAKSFELLRKKSDSRVWYSFHFYDPAWFTHNGIYSPVVDREYKGDTLLIKNHIKEVIAFRLKYPKATIYAGEFGTCTNNKPSERLKWYSQVMEVFKEYNINWTFHAWREWEGWDIENYPKILALFKRNWK
jgi:endoglucanase